MKNLFNAALYTNSRLSNPAIKVLKDLFKKSANLEMGQRIYNNTAWKGWEKVIIEGILKS